MKAKITKLSLVVLIPLLYFLIISSFKNEEIGYPPVDYTPRNFTNCIFNPSYAEYPNIPQWYILNNLDKYKELNFNAIQWYDAGSTEFGRFEDVNLSNSQINRFKGVLDSIEDKGLLGFYDRVRLSQPCYGQRLVYEVGGQPDNTDLNYGFVYQHCMSQTYTTDQGRTVLHAVPSTNQAGYLSKDIYENIQHSDLFDFQRNERGTWYIKPVMRIPTGLADSTSVVKIEVIPFSGGNPAKTIIIRAGNFKDGNGVYNGNYVDQYRGFSANGGLEIQGDTASGSLNHGRTAENEWENWPNTCHVDFKVYWYGQAEVWFDNMVVDDRLANELFNPSTQGDYNTRIQEEIQYFTNYGSNYCFYADELTPSEIPCIKYVMNKMREYCASNPEPKLSFALTNYLHVHGLRNRELSYKPYFDSLQVDFVQTDCHSFYDGIIPNVLPQYDTRVPSSWFKPSSVYNQWLQDYAFGHRYSDPPLGYLVSQINKTRSNINQYSDNAKFIMQPQLHAWLFSTDESSQYLSGLREPTNEELQAQAMISIAQGADALCWFTYNSKRFVEHPDLNPLLTNLYGLLNIDFTKREHNLYGQNKWKYVSEMNDKFLNWKPTLDLVKWDTGYSVHFEGANHNFISDIKSIKRYPALEYTDTSNCANCDDTNERYWEMGFFRPDFVNPEVSAVDKSRYFIMVNRRCIPDLDNHGDFRRLRIMFDSTQLTGFVNWKIIDLDTNNVVSTFNKNTTAYVNFGEFKPGEGKLYKLAPVMQEGGTLIADEDCGGFEFECRGEVNNDGHDIAIKPGTEIKFADPSARIIMSGGEFKSGLYDSPTAQVNLTATNGNSWKGLKFENCNSVELFNTEFTNVAPYPQDSTYAVEIVDCRHINISGCKFYSELDLETGAVLMNFVSHTDPPIEPEVYLSGNLFKMDAGSIPAVSIVATGYYEIPALMEWNNFESYTGNSALAILLSNVTGGAIKENNFTGYDRTVFMLGSSMDFYGNYIIGSDQSSIGIVQHSASNANLSGSEEMFTGGYNSITAEGQTAKCIQLSNSYLLIDEGYNIFRLEDSQTNNYQLEGTIPNDVGADPYPAENNCFQLGNSLLVKHNLRWIDETAINLDTVPSSCNSERPENFIVFNLGNGINDTVRYESGGSGGGESNAKLEIKNYKYGEASEAGSISETVSLKVLSDSVSINLRKRNYEKVTALCREMLTDYADSINDASIISKLYLAELKQDTSSSGMLELKSFLESYILNNPQKEMMIRQAFYFIQKCKVSLGLYESAMTGFQQIINQFPYSYEGLLASWDYAATSLLNSNVGSGAGKNSMHISELPDEEIISYTDDPHDVYDIRKFSNDDRKTLNENLTKTFSSHVNKQTHEIKSLEEKLTKNEATNTEKKKYQEMRTLKDVVKARKPENVGIHVSMISDDLSRIMKSTGSEVSDKYEENILPTEFALHQNYPNPFNPATKISFDLPQDSRVNLIVYDLLGREVTMLVNNEFKVAGKYTYDFNAA
jgi:hypothetical protein